MEEFNLKLTSKTSDLKDKKKIFYLGAWCLADVVDDNLNNSLIHEYHWNNRKKLVEDYNGLTNFISYNFGTFSKYMANITKAPNDQRYWKINLEIWLGYLIQILYDRWESIRTLPEFKFNLQKINYDISYIRANTVRDFFTDLFTDNWNEIVYRLILDAQNKKINYKSINTDETQSPIDNNSKNIKTNSLSFNLKVSKFLTELIHKFYQPDIFIINSYLSRINEIKLQLLLKELPLNYKRPIFDPKFDYKDITNEKNIKKELNPINLIINENSSWDVQNKDFLVWFNKILPFFIPYNYSIKFKEFSENMRKLPFPKNPKLIFTSVLHIQHDYFNLYTSEKVYNGAKYIIGQHGGGFRSMEVCYNENIHKDLSDYYLTWGKDRLNDNSFPSKVIAVGNLKTSSKKIKKKNINNQRALLLTVEYPRFSYVLTSAVISSQWLEYYEDLKKFLQKTSDLGLSEKITIRNKLRGYGWNMGGKLSNQFPSLKYDDIKDYYNSLQSSSIVISTYNGATYLETMSLNIPTIFYWNPLYWELNKNSKIAYDELSKVGIFHTNPISAAEFYNNIKNDINSWWYSQKVQLARQSFCEKYSIKNKNISHEIMNIIKNAIK